MRNLRIRRKRKEGEEVLILGPDESTKVPIPDSWLGDWKPTLKGLGGRCWSWWLPKTLAGRIFFLTVMGILVTSIPTLIILGALGIID